MWLASTDYGRAGTSDSSLPSKEPDTPATSETHSLKIDVDRSPPFSGTINEDSLTPIDSPVNPSQSSTEGTAVGVGLLDRFKLLGSKIFTAAAAVRAGPGSTAQMQSRWPHESKVEAGTMCVWSNAGEVVPFISSSNRTALPPFESIHCYFQQGVLAVSGVLHEEKADEMSETTPRGKGRMILPPQTEILSVGKQVEVDGHGFQSDAGVTYFGIDCRNERERSLGLFPRVRHMLCIGLH